MSTNPTGGWFVIKHPQYVEEEVFGTIPGSPTMSWIGPSESWDPRAEKPPIEIRQLGSEDPKYLLEGRQNYSFTLEHFMQDPSWVAYAINPQGGGTPFASSVPGTIDKSVSIVAGIRMGGAGGTAKYYIMKGCRPNSVTLTGRVNEAIRCRMEMLCREIPAPSNDPPSGWTEAIDPGTTPMIFTSGGVYPINVSGSGPSGNVPATEISVTVERNLEPIYVIGSGITEWLPAKQRTITGSMTLVWNNTDRYTDLASWNTKQLTWVLSDGNQDNSTPTTLVLTGVKFHRLDSFTVRPTEVVMERWSFQALTATIS